MSVSVHPPTPYDVPGQAVDDMPGQAAGLLHVPISDALRQALTALGDGAVSRETDRTLAFQEIRALLDAGIGRLRVPEKFGGFGLNWVQTTEVLLVLAAEDSNVLQALRAHLAVEEEALWRGPEDPAAAQWLWLLGQGQSAGNAWTEPGVGGLHHSGTIVRRTPDGLRISGEKAYTTGSIFADWLDVTAADEDGRELGVLVRRDQPGVQVRDDWNGFGQRTSGSGGLTLDEAEVAQSEVRELTDRFPYQTGLYQHILLTVLAGIAEAAARDISREVRVRTRVYSHGNAEHSAADPQLLQVVGEVDAAAAVARASVVESARSLDRALATRTESEQSQQRAATEVELATARAQVGLHRLVLDAVTKIFDALGASGVAAPKALDRHWRNARTVTSHNPWVFKARILGDHRVNGTEPVRLWTVGEPVRAEGQSR